MPVLIWTIERADSPEGPWTEIAAKQSSVKYTDKAVENGYAYYRITPYHYELKGEMSDTV